MAGKQRILKGELSPGAIRSKKIVPPYLLERGGREVLISRKARSVNAVSMSLGSDNLFRLD